MEDSNTVALAGIIATATVAVLGLVVQSLVAWAARRHERRRARYEELVEVYDSVGWALTDLQRYFDFLVEWAGDTTGEAEHPGPYPDELWTAVSHTYSAMMMHQVPASVLAATEAHHKRASMLLRKGPNQVTDDDVREVDVLLRRFYAAAGDHLRTVWKPHEPRTEYILEPPITGLTPPAPAPARRPARRRGPSWRTR